LFPLGDSNGIIVLLRDETGEAGVVFECDFHCLETVGHLLRRIDEGVGQFGAWQAARHSGQVGAEDAALATGQDSSAVAGVALKAFVNRRSPRGAAPARRVAQDEPVQFFVASFGTRGFGGGQKLFAESLAIPIFPKSECGGSFSFVNAALERGSDIVPVTLIVAGGNQQSLGGANQITPGADKFDQALRQ
jgi:hypothetical protein